MHAAGINIGKIQFLLIESTLGIIIWSTNWLPELMLLNVSYVCVMFSLFGNFSRKAFISVKECTGWTPNVKYKLGVKILFQKAVKSSYDSIRGSYADRINKITGQKDGVDYLTDYTQPSVAEDLIQQGKDAKIAVDEFVKTHPDVASKIASFYDIPGTTDQDVNDWIKLNYPK